VADNLAASRVGNRFRVAPVANPIRPDSWACSRRLK
jgi:hypothetical protein